MIKRNQILPRIASLGASTCFLFTTIAAPFAQASLWSERSQAAARQRRNASEPALLASARLGAGEGPAAPSTPLGALRNDLSALENAALKGKSAEEVWSEPSLTQLVNRHRQAAGRKQARNREIPSWLWEKISPYGNVESAHLAANFRWNLVNGKIQTSAPIVVHLQDVHGVAGVQKNLAFLETELMNLGVELVGLEGAEGKLEGMDLWRQYPDRETLLQVSGYLLEQGFLTGSEVAGVARANEKVEFLGLEEKAKYLDQVRSFKETLPLSAETAQWREQFEKRLTQMKDRIYGPRMKELDEAKRKFDRGQMPLGEWLETLAAVTSDQYPVTRNGKANNQNKILSSSNAENWRSREAVTETGPRLALNSTARSNNNDLDNRGQAVDSSGYRLPVTGYRSIPSAFPNIQRYLQTYAVEKTLDFNQVREDQKDLMKTLSEELSRDELNGLVQDSLLYRLGRMDYGEFYGNLKARCRRAGIRLPPAMAKYIEYSTGVESIVHQELYEELGKFEEAAWQKAVTGDQNKRFYSSSAAGEQSPPQRRIDREAVIETGSRLALNPTARSNSNSFYPSSERSESRSGNAQADLHRLDKDFGLVKKAMDFTLSPAEWKGYAAREPEILKLEERLHAVSPTGSALAPLPASLTAALSGTSRFNRLSEERSAVFADRIARKMEFDKVRVAVLVAGGYHSQDVEEALRDRNLSYITIRPRMTSEEVKNAPHPLHAFRRDLVPLEKMFLPERVTISPALVQGGDLAVQSDPARAQATSRIARFLTGAFEKAARAKTTTSGYPALASLIKEDSDPITFENPASIARGSWIRLVARVAGTTKVIFIPTAGLAPNDRNRLLSQPRAYLRSVTESADDSASTASGMAENFMSPSKPLFFIVAEQNSKWMRFFSWLGHRSPDSMTAESGGAFNLREIGMWGAAGMLAATAILSLPGLFGYGFFSPAGLSASAAAIFFGIPGVFYVKDFVLAGARRLLSGTYRQNMFPESWVALAEKHLGEEVTRSDEPGKVKLLLVSQMEMDRKYGWGTFAHTDPETKTVEIADWLARESDRASLNWFNAWILGTILDRERERLNRTSNLRIALKRPFSVFYHPAPAPIPDQKLLSRLVSNLFTNEKNRKLAAGALNYGTSQGNNALLELMIRYLSSTSFKVHKSNLTVYDSTKESLDALRRLGVSKEEEEVTITASSGFSMEGFRKSLESVIPKLIVIELDPAGKLPMADDDFNALHDLAVQYGFVIAPIVRLNLENRPAFKNSILAQEKFIRGEDARVALIFDLGGPFENRLPLSVLVAPTPLSIKFQAVVAAKKIQANPLIQALLVQLLNSKYPLKIGDRINILIVTLLNRIIAHFAKDEPEDPYAWMNDQFLTPKGKKIVLGGVRLILKLLGNYPKAIPLAAGSPNDATFPYGTVNDILQDLIGDPSIWARLGQDAPLEGTQELRDAVAQRANVELQTEVSQDNVLVTRDNVLVTDGSQESPDLLGQMAEKEGRSIELDIPNYVGAESAIKSHTVNINYHRYSKDLAGLEEAKKDLLERIESGDWANVPLFLMIQARFINPSGHAMTVEHVRALRKMVQELNEAIARTSSQQKPIRIVADDPYGALDYGTDQEQDVYKAVIRTLFEGSNGELTKDVIYLDSASKKLTPIRVGWVIAHPSTLNEFKAAKLQGCQGTNTLSQFLVAKFMSSGKMDEHIKSTLVPFYKKNRQAMIAATETYLQGLNEQIERKYGADKKIKTTAANGGMFVSVYLPAIKDKINTMKLMEELVKGVMVEGKKVQVSIIPFRAGFVSEEMAESGNWPEYYAIRLSYSRATPEQIDLAVRAIGIKIAEKLDIAPAQDELKEIRAGIETVHSSLKAGRFEEAEKSQERVRRSIQAALERIPDAADEDQKQVALEILGALYALEGNPSTVEPIVRKLFKDCEVIFPEIHEDQLRDRFESYGVRERRIVVSPRSEDGAAESSKYRDYEDAFSAGYARMRWAAGLRYAEKMPNTWIWADISKAGGDSPDSVRLRNAIVKILDQWTVEELRQMRQPGSKGGIEFMANHEKARDHLLAVLQGKVDSEILEKIGLIPVRTDPEQNGADGRIDLDRLFPEIARLHPIVMTDDPGRIYSSSGARFLLLKILSDSIAIIMNSLESFTGEIKELRILRFQA